MRYHLTHVRMGIIRKNRDKYCENVEKGEVCWWECILV